MLPLSLCLLLQIAFEGITENGFQGDMAIDDVSVKDGECETGEGVQAVVVQFNTSAIIRDAKQFARNVKRLRLARIPARAKRRAGLLATEGLGVGGGGGAFSNVQQRGGGGEDKEGRGSRDFKTLNEKKKGGRGGGGGERGFQNVLMKTNCYFLHEPVRIKGSRSHAL